jgi:hypothetical protein
MLLVDTARLTVSTIEILATGTSWWKGSNTWSGGATPNSRPAFSLPATPPTLPQAGLVRDVSKEGNLAVLPNSTLIAVLDVTAEVTLSQFDGRAVSLCCITAADDEIAITPSQWPRGASNLKLIMSPQGDF